MPICSSSARSHRVFVLRTAVAGQQTPNNPLLNLSFTIMRYRGSSRLDDDMHFLFKTTDQLVTVGSDFPEYSPADALARLATLTQGIDEHRIENICWRNLERWFPAP